jgi:uncharacterized hydrophobic protein (TIGR00271 family)
MFHVRVVCQSEATDQVVGLLDDHEEIVNLLVQPAGAVRPPGDVVQFDLQAAAANKVMRELSEIRADEYAPVTVHSVDLSTLDLQPRSRSWHRPHLGENAPFWGLAQAKIQADATYAPSFFILLMIAGVIAACGILTNSQILIVAAMVVGPEYGAILAVAAGLEGRNWPPVRDGLIALVGGFLLAILVTYVFALCIRALGKTPTAYGLGLRPVSDLINSPNLYSVVVAVLAGVVGVVALAESKAGAMVGVFISITTIPAAADIAVSLAYHLWSEARGSAYQLLLNVGLLIIIGALALLVFHRTWHGDKPAYGRSRSR